VADTGDNLFNRNICAEDNDGWIIRAVETGGRNASADIDCGWIGVSGTFSFGPYEIKTIKYSDKNRDLTETGLLEQG